MPFRPLRYPNLAHWFYRNRTLVGNQKPPRQSNEEASLAIVLTPLVNRGLLVIDHEDSFGLYGNGHGRDNAPDSQLFDLSGQLLLDVLFCCESGKIWAGIAER